MRRYLPGAALLLFLLIALLSGLYLVRQRQETRKRAAGQVLASINIHIDCTSPDGMCYMAASALDGFGRPLSEKEVEYEWGVSTTGAGRLVHTKGPVSGYNPATVGDGDIWVLARDNGTTLKKSFAVGKGRQEKEVFEKSVNPEASYSIPVLVISFYPTRDGVNLDPGITGIADTIDKIRQKVKTLSEQAEETLERASTYHGYKDASARPSLDYQIIAGKEFQSAMPLSNNEVPGKEGQGVYRPDYQKILEDVNVCDYVENKGVGQVWIWGYHHGSLEPTEANMAGPHGDISSSERISDMPTCRKTYTMFNYNYGRGLGEALENHGHQIEAVLRFVDNELFWNKFVGPYGNEVGDRRCGWTHFAPNGTEDYDWQNEKKVMSDCEDWKPEGGGFKELDCHSWYGEICRDDGGVAFKTWWMQNLPGRDNNLSYQEKKLRNWWDFIGDFDAAMGKGKSLTLAVAVTPTPSPTPVSSPISTTIPGDINGDKKVNAVDLGIMIDVYGSAPPKDSRADLDRDGAVNAIDLGILIDNYER